MIILYLTLIGLSSGIGAIIYFNFKKQKDYYKSLFDFLCAYKQNLLYLQKSLPEFISSFDCLSKDFKKTLQIFNESMFNENVSIYYPEYLSRNEIEDIKNIIASLGTTDTYTQVDITEKFKVTIDEQYQKSNEKFNKYAPLSIKLGFILGILIVVLLI